MANDLTAQLKEVSKEILTAMQTAVGRNTGKKVGRSVVARMKDSVKSGRGTLRGFGRLKSYKPSYVKQIQGKLTFRRFNGRVVPIDLTKNKKFLRENRKKFAGKRVRPVNLRLSGDFLRDLRFKFGFKSGSTQVGFFNRESINKELGHRTGANSQRKRPIIPFGTRRFTRQIEQLITKVYETEIIKLLKTL